MVGRSRLRPTLSLSPQGPVPVWLDSLILILFVCLTVSLNLCRLQLILIPWHRLAVPDTIRATPGPRRRRPQHRAIRCRRCCSRCDHEGGGRTAKPNQVNPMHSNSHVFNKQTKCAKFYIFCLTILTTTITVTMMLIIIIPTNNNTIIDQRTYTLCKLTFDRASSSRP